MTLNINNKINAFLHSEEAFNILNCKDFYFQNGQDSLRKFLDYELTEDLKDYLNQNVKEYEELKDFFENSPDLQDFGKLLFSLISYCDSNAYRKKELNQYPDKRVLAFAFVRMNNWVEQLLSYKFGLPIPDGSPKNAIEYLINPADNFTMLSENHREQLSENLFNKKYSKTAFKEEVFKYFEALALQPSNSQNYSHLLSRLCYQIETEWKRSIIGIVSPDRTGWQEDAINITKEGNYIALWNHKRPNGTDDTLKGLRHCIYDKGYFEIFYTSNYNVNYVAEIVDFVSNQKELHNAKWLDKFGNVEWYHDNFAEYNDKKKYARWIYLAKRIYKVEAESLTNYKFYKGNNYPSVGGQSPIVSINRALVLKNQKEMEDKINLLKYKKQIILQGPPGTGKTKLAKKLASELIGTKPTIALDWQKFIRGLDENQKIKSIHKDVFYTIRNVVNNDVTLSFPSTSDEIISYDKIKSIYDLKSWNNNNSLNHKDLGAVSLAKALFEKYNFSGDIYSSNEQLKIVQFHPSYTYEDFVRGVSAESNGASIEYKNVNRTLGLFAKEALLNFLDSKKSKSRLKSDLTFNEKFNSFKTSVISSLAEGKYFKIPNTTAQIIDVDDIQFKYTFSTNPSYNYSLLFSDFFKLYELGGDFKTSSDITRLESHLTRLSVGTYYFHLYKLIESQSEIVEDIEVPPLENYVLIIDEINRANLSSVLGELIYALEYRGEAVESMYAIDGNNKLILPPNLYIIGTMNTADRSVGHIDYAIRRRFAFVDVLPKDLTMEEGIVFKEDIFKQVTSLFINNYDPEIDYSSDFAVIEKSVYLTADFEPKDVWLGHSYFIQQYEKDQNGDDDLSKPIDFSLRINYEIKPILEEYIKDGILKETAREVIMNLA
ncbi:5-methylcytosine-specific restriction enzyme B [Pedobacter sp. Bi27]|uniref:AAA family ATPase n=1 Tax=Pedobacter sp. Bi27 TaxID=2822351 RepID=UPI001DD4EAD1|nr:AAA family ATPase [Pedobacter sp. Bi27]CAH0137602.1 5-methylcytosine-specific restriction enzyme B [Pedobacter sp. Bi27]